MKDDEIFKELEELLTQLDVKIRFGRGYFKGGLCRYKDEKYFYLNRTDDKEKHISLILEELEKMDLKNVEIPTMVGEILSKSEA